MKMTLSTIAISTLSSVAAAHDTSTYNESISQNVFKISATIFAAILFMIFIFSVLKRILDYRIKNRIVERGVSEDLASSLLRPNTGDRNVNIKWFLTLTGIGIGLTLVNYTLPLGIHSIAIMSFTIAASFLAYHEYMKRSGK